MRLLIAFPLFAGILSLCGCSDDSSAASNVGANGGSAGWDAAADGSASPDGAAGADGSTPADGSAGSSGEAGFDAGKPGIPELVYFNYLPAGDTSVLGSIDLQVSRHADGWIYVEDKVQAGKVSYYALNGSVSRLDARTLSQQPIPPNRWIHLVKFVADIDNVNSDGWKTSAQYTGGNDTKFAATFESSFYVKDGTLQPPLGHTEPLWTSATVDDGLIFKATPAFALPPGKKYGSESVPADELPDNLAKVSWNTAEDKFRLLYASTVVGLMSAVGAQKPDGVTTFDDARMAQAADYLAAATPSAIFAVDFEPADPTQDAWMWDYLSPSFGPSMQKLSSLIYQRSGKYFYSWIGSGTSFEHHGKTLTLDGYTSGNWQGNGFGIDDYLQVHENPAGTSNVIKTTSKLQQLGFGYTSTVINTSDSASEGPAVWKSPVAWYLRALDYLNLQSLLAQDEKFLVFLWPFEDQPNDAKRSPMTLFTLPGYQGKVRQTDNRVLYPPNLIRDALVTFLCHPRVTYANYWIFGESYDPVQSLLYARINGVQSCQVAGTPDFHVYEYEGPDNPACPSGTANYMTKDILGVAAMVQGHEIFARHLAATLDGTQVRESLDSAFTYTRSDGVEQAAQWKADTGEFARAFKFAQPWVQVWKNPSTGKRVLLFQDSFAEGFEPVKFKVVVAGTTVERTAVGNNLYYEVM